MMDTEELVINEIRVRKEVGLKKYGVSVADNPLDALMWLQHLKEEMLDGSIYATRLQQELQRLFDELHRLREELRRYEDDGK